MTEKTKSGWHRQLHWQIMIALAMGLTFGFVVSYLDSKSGTGGWAEFSRNWVFPWGDIFLRLLKLIAMPLVLTSLIAGVASLSDFNKLSRMGTKTIGIYIATTAVSVSIGLLVVNTFKPGEKLPAELRDSFAHDGAGVLESKMATVVQVKGRPALQPLVDMVPDNFFGSASSNSNMLQMVFFALLAGVALVRMPRNKAKPVVDVVEGLGDMVILMVRMIMLIAPIGVFALISSTIVGLAKDDPSRVVDLMKGLGFYAFCVILGLLLHVCIVYLPLVKFVAKISLQKFLSALGPAQLLAFSTSSSGATLPVTMRRCREELGVSNEVTSFVLPLGATINMDGTALYQGVAAVFIAQALGIPLEFGDQIKIVLTAVLASIGTAAVPGAGMVMLIVILESINVPAAGIALIAGIDRPLDMMRTVCNVTGDATVTTVISAGEKKAVA